MEAIRKLFQRATSSNHSVSYQAIQNESSTSDETDPLQSGLNGNQDHEGLHREAAFSWLDYSVFIMLGVAMLWAWNMFLAAGPYFQKRFKGDEWLLKNFQPAELSVSTVGNLGFVILLTKMQADASYSRRVVAALVLNIAVFISLAVSTQIGLDVSPATYFTFLMAQILLTAAAAGLMQNGIFAFAASFTQEQYTQGLMTGQAIAGVVPAAVQLLLVLLTVKGDTPDDEATSSSGSTFAYFSTAAVISLTTLLAFVPLAARKKRNEHFERIADGATMSDSVPDLQSQPKSQGVPLLRLLRKTRWLASSVFVTFTITMMYPVYTQKIRSVGDPITSPVWTSPSTFIPVAFLFWNTGDLVGRLLTAIPGLRLTSKPRVLLALAAARVLFLPLYQACNVNGEGAAVNSDLFYLVVVQFLFGISNGFIGSTCMMGAVEYVDASEREAAGGFMGLCLIAGLTAGSLLSFLVA